VRVGRSAACANFWLLEGLRAGQTAGDARRRQRTLGPWRCRPEALRALGDVLLLERGLRARASEGIGEHGPVENLGRQLMGAREHPADRAALLA
jgi:hypothetical protein